MKISRNGYPLASESATRRTVTRICAPILSNLNRIYIVASPPEPQDHRIGENT